VTAADPSALARVRDSLAREFSGIFSPETVAACLTESYEHLLATARVERTWSSSPSDSLVNAFEPPPEWRVRS